MRLRWITGYWRRELAIKKAEMELSEQNHRAEVFALEQSLQQTEAQRDEFKTKAAAMESERDKYKQIADRFTEHQPADICIYCRRPTGEVIKHLPASNMTRDWAWREAYIYKCSNPECGKEYGKPVKPVAQQVAGANPDYRCQ
jgi:hypothetical protein